MDTTSFLLNLIDIRKAPGDLPIISKSDLDTVKNCISLHSPETIFYVAAACNEPAIVEYILDRYNINPNETLPSMMYSAYYNVLTFACIEVLDVFMERHLFPDSWYGFFMQTYKYNDIELMNYVIENYSQHIHLKQDEIDKLCSLRLPTTVRDYLYKSNLS